jgi:hypothetical protein
MRAGRECTRSKGKSRWAGMGGRTRRAFGMSATLRRPYPMVAASKEASGKGSSMASPCTHSTGAARPGRRAARPAARAAASSSMAPEKSRPTTYTARSEEDLSLTAIPGHEARRRRKRQRRRAGGAHPAARPRHLGEDGRQIAAAAAHVQGGAVLGGPAPLDRHPLPDAVQAEAELVVELVVDGGDAAEELLPRGALRPGLEKSIQRGVAAGG